jgi:uncharacterized protein
MGMPHGTGCTNAPICGKNLAIEHDGSVYSCDHTVYPKYYLGNIKDRPLAKMALSNQQAKFGMAKNQELTSYCEECKYLFACNGGCPKNWFLRTPIGEPGLNYLCSGMKKYYSHIDPYMNEFARQISNKDM